MIQIDDQKFNSLVKMNTHPSLDDMFKLINTVIHNDRDRKTQEEKEHEELKESLRQKVKLDTEYYIQHLASMKTNGETSRTVWLENLDFEHPFLFLEIHNETFNQLYGKYFRLDRIMGAMIRNNRIQVQLTIVNSDF